MNLDIIFDKYELYYDELDCNTIHLITKNGYFFISMCVYLDKDDPDLEKPYFELNDQLNSQQGGIEQIIISSKTIEIEFLEKEKFLDEYSTVAIHFEKIDKTVVDFFNNYLFLGDFIKYSIDFPKENIVLQTEQRQYL